MVCPVFAERPRKNVGRGPLKCAMTACPWEREGPAPPMVSSQFPPLRWASVRLSSGLALQEVT
ncbi:hypothetical protein PC114_g18546 [Phytophthora cactorum]|nr:hypothetical protein PC114_g18546 [Phytophthora cactorum]